MSVPHLLPPRSTTSLEATLSQAVAQLSDVPVPIDQVKRPDDAPADFVPLLAWERGLKLWVRDWPEHKKRAAARLAPEICASLGTLRAMELTLSLVDAQIQSYVIPPVGAFAAPDRTPAERAAFVALFPELRIYLRSEPGTADADLYADDGFADDGFATVSTAHERYGRRGEIHDGGTVTPVSLLPVTWAGADAINADLIGVVIPGEDDGGGDPVGRGVRYSGPLRRHGSEGRGDGPVPGDRRYGGVRGAVSGGEETSATGIDRYGVFRYE